MPNPLRSTLARRLLVATLWLASIAATVGATRFVKDNWERIIKRLGLAPMTQLVSTNLYTIRVEKRAIPIDGRYGAIEPLRDGVLFASRSGKLFFIDSGRVVHPLAVRVPINIDEFESDPENAGTIDRDHFAVKDLLVESLPTSVRLVASFNHWDAAQNCYVLRVATVEVPIEELLSGSAGTATWQRRFETAPCRELSLLSNGQRRPTIGAGGRLVSLGGGIILVTVGPFGTESAMAEDPVAAQNADNPFGKTIRIDLADGTHRIFTRGHRNPQGLAVAADGRVWLTEHAARGGDELNLLQDGADFGWPKVSYGTAYGMMTWPSNPEQGRHEGAAKPMHAWVPSIGISQVIALGGDRFPSWKGDLFIGSLVGRTLFRVRVEDDRVIFVEPIPLGHRMRDVIQTADGRLVLLAEDGFLLYVTPLREDAVDPTMLPRERGQLVASRCQGCHTFEAGGVNGLGPNLHGVVGRRIASARGFTYSQSLQSRSGRWTEEALRGFIEDPAGSVPGTAMALPGPKLTAGQLDDLLIYLRSLR